MNHCTHHCLVPLAEPHICYTAGKDGQSQRRCVCCTRKEFFAIASYAFTHYIYPGGDRMGILCGMHSIYWACHSECRVWFYYRNYRKQRIKPFITLWKLTVLVLPVKLLSSCFTSPFAFLWCSHPKERGWQNSIEMSVVVNSPNLKSHFLRNLIKEMWLYNDFFLWQILWKICEN